MPAIGFDFDLLTKPYGTQRCIYQLFHYCKISQLLGLDVKAIVNKDVVKACPILREIKDIWADNRRGLDIYVSKANAMYFDHNWNDVTRKLNAFKVAMCNSDRCFREHTGVHDNIPSTAVQTRCDLYMPVNYSSTLLKDFGHKTIPVAHPIDIRMFKEFYKECLDTNYYNDDVDTIRSHYYEPEVGIARFMGNKTPDRLANSTYVPWGEVSWEKKQPSREYIRFMMQARACLDFRGFGDKSIRFTEAVLLGRTIITVAVTSQYSPPLIDDYNCILRPNWAAYQDTHRELDESWSKMANIATNNYKSKWSLRAQVLSILDRFNASK